MIIISIDSRDLEFIYKTFLLENNSSEENNEFYAKEQVIIDQILLSKNGYQELFCSTD